MATEDRTHVTLRLGPFDTGQWETLTGREMDSEGDVYRPGPGAAQRADGGPKTYSEAVVTRTWDDTRDGNIYRTLNTYGSRATGTLSEQPLDEDYNAFDQLTAWPVRLKGLKRPDVNINGTDRKMFEITLWIEGDPS